MKRAKYDPLLRSFKSVTGALRAGESALFRVAEEGESCRMELLSESGGDFSLRMSPEEGGFFAEVRLFQPGLYRYRFVTPRGAIGEGGDGRGEYGAPPYLLLVYDGDYATPDWIKGGVIYQIFPDRFCRSRELSAEEFSVLKPRGTYHKDKGDTPRFAAVRGGAIANDDYFGGDLEGIRRSLGYLSRLGVTALYLNPVFESPSNHRYDTGDYEKIDPLLGDESDFRRLAKEAAALGISLILDGVFNHTGADSRYFNKYGNYPSLGAYQSERSPYRSWYRFGGAAEYESWWGVEILPSVEESDPGYADFIAGETGVVRKWLKAGARGWRLDVADELPDAFIEKIRAAAKAEGADNLLLGEVWEDASDKISYGARRRYLQGRELDSVMNYPVREGLLSYLLTGDEKPFVRALRREIDRYPAAALAALMNLLGTHDTPRVLTLLGGAKEEGRSPAALAEDRLSPEARLLAENRLIAAAAILYLLPGVPAVYYGDERGAEGWGDPFNRRFLPEEASEKLLSAYTRLGRLRGEYRGVLAEGDTSFVLAEQGAVVLERRSGAGALVLAVNLGGKIADVCFSAPVRTVFSHAFGCGEIERREGANGISFALPSRSLAVFAP